MRFWIKEIMLALMWFMIFMGFIFLLMYGFWIVIFVIPLALLE